MTGALSNRLIVAIVCLSVTLSSALGAFVVVPVNDLIGDDLVRQVAARAQLATLARDGATLPAGLAVYRTQADLRRAVEGFRPTVADWARRDDARYRRAELVGQRAYAVAGTGDGRLVLAALDRGGAVERQERIGLLLSLVLVLTATMGWALWAGASYTRRLGRVAAVARRAADGDFSARAGLGGRDEVAGLGHDVDRMAGRLGALERARSEFVAKVSHDLRTPLTVIRGYAWTLERHATGEDRRRLHSIGRETDRLAALVDDLLTLSQAGAGALRVTKAVIDADDLLEEVEERIHATAAARGVTVAIEADDDLLLHGDRRRLAQVLTNLATNAVRHTPDGGGVVLGARAGADGGVELVVADDGEGIDPTRLPTLLRPFEHGDGPSGTGLGLSIAVELVQAHGGRLELLPRDGGGTVASAWLPSAPAVAELSR